MSPTLRSSNQDRVINDEQQNWRFTIHTFQLPTPPLSLRYPFASEQIDNCSPFPSFFSLAIGNGRRNTLMWEVRAKTPPMRSWFLLVVYWLFTWYQGSFVWPDQFHQRHALPGHVEFYMYPHVSHVKKKANIHLYPRPKKKHSKKYLTTSIQPFSRYRTRVGILSSHNDRAINGDTFTCDKLFLIPIS